MDCILSAFVSRQKIFLRKSFTAVEGRPKLHGFVSYSVILQLFQNFRLMLINATKMRPAGPFRCTDCLNPNICLVVPPMLTKPLYTNTHIRNGSRFNTAITVKGGSFGLPPTYFLHKRTFTHLSKSFLCSRTVVLSLQTSPFSDLRKRSSALASLTALHHAHI